MRTCARHASTALALDREAVRAYAMKYTWRASAEEFVRNLQPYPEPEKTRFWKRFRRLTRLRRRRQQAAAKTAASDHHTAH